MQLNLALDFRSSNEPIKEAVLFTVVGAGCITVVFGGVLHGCVFSCALQCSKVLTGVHEHCDDPVPTPVHTNAASEQVCETMKDCARKRPESIRLASESDFGKSGSSSWSEEL